MRHDVGAACIVPPLPGTPLGAPSLSGQCVHACAAAAEPAEWCGTVCEDLAEAIGVVVEG